VAHPGARLNSHWTGFKTVARPGRGLANLQVGCVDHRVVMQIIGWSQPSTIMRCLEARLGYPSPSVRSMS